MPTPKGISLSIGLNRVDSAHYGGWSGALVACEADAEDMNDIAQKQGYATTLLRTDAATRGAVIKGIRNAAKNLVKGDSFFLFYSGHGGQLPDRNGDEYDLRDETWCLYDGELIDDELRVLWGEFAEGVRVFVMSDSCHSGTVTKLAYYSRGTGIMTPPAGVTAANEQIRYKYMPPEIALRTYRNNREFYDNLNAALPKLLPVQASVRLISGCQDNQFSMDGEFNGLFTGTVLRVWSGGLFTSNYHQFHKEIQSRMPPWQSPNHYFFGLQDLAYDEQIPFTIGTVERKKRK